MQVPEPFLAQLTDGVRETFLVWVRYLRDRVDFLLPQSSLHAKEHAARVLLYALILAARLHPGNARALEILAHAAVFHDARRRNEWYDTGHGARAAVYYRSHCQSCGLPFYPEAQLVMRFHDLDDVRGLRGIAGRCGTEAPFVQDLFALFKDADALDRWRLGEDGLDAAYLRHEEARELMDFARELVQAMGAGR